MNKIVSTVCAMALGWSFTLPAGASPEENIQAYQDYFKKRFPEVALEDYQDGVNSLPQYAHRRANWELLMEFPPYEEQFQQGLEEWKQPFANGKTFDDCFADLPPATEYPWYSPEEDDIHTIERDINDCLRANGEKPFKNLKRGKIARLVAAFRSQSNGEPWSVDVSHPGAQKWFEKGQEFFWTKRGQLNFSCADCHVHNSGNRIRGDVLSPGLGHGSGFPVWRTKWSVAGKPWGTIHRRYGGCMKQVRAQPLAPQTEELKALEFYEAAVSTGVPLKVPSQRQ